jgi:hypothetical protein
VSERSKDKDKDKLKITNQFRDKRGMVYDLKCEGDRLTVYIAPRENATDAGEWRVEVRASATGVADAVVLAEWGATRADALREVGRAWTTNATSTGLPAFDWDAVATALTAVRAL